MKQLLYLFLLVTPSLSAQTYDFEEGSSGGFLQWPAEHWAPSSKQGISGEYSMKHSFDNSEASVDFLYLENEYPVFSDTLAWSFSLRHAYKPSSSNNWQFYMLTTEAVFDKNTEGFYGLVFGVNYDCSDDLLKLWQHTTSGLKEICCSEYNFQEDMGIDSVARFQIWRYPEGEWKIELRESGSFREIAKGKEMPFMPGKYTGIRYAYSSSQDRKLWLDDVTLSGRYMKDSAAPELHSSKIVSSNSVLLEFSEPVLIHSNSVFYLEEDWPDSVQLKGEFITLAFEREFPNRVSMELRMTHISDGEGNVLKDTSVLLRMNQAEFGDVIFNELHIDPEPVIYLPAYEYIELFNRSKERVDLEGWSITVNERFYGIGKLVLEADEFAILTTHGAGQYFRNREVCEIFSSGTALRNSGAELFLRDSIGRIIHRSRYESLESYDVAYSDGGWSLERLDPDNLCGGIKNWGFSEAWKGGTPGEQNSIQGTLSDWDKPHPLYIGLVDSVTLGMNFSETVLFSDIWPEATLNEGGLEIKKMHSPQIDEQIYLISKTAFKEESIYSLELAGVSDCASNMADKISYTFSVPKLPKQGDLLINELMYDPLPGGVEFIELVNISDHFIDLSDLKLGDIEMSSDSRLIGPEGIVVLTPSERELRQEWDLNWDILVQEIPNWKALVNNDGLVAINSRSGQLIDDLYYADSMHFDYLATSSGFSLERVAYSPINTMMLTASTFLRATPGRVNSQFQELSIGDEDLSIYPEVIRPNGDGFEDYISITIPSRYAGSLIDVYVTDLKGFVKRHLLRDEILGRDEIITWDAKDDQSLTLGPGLYVMHVYMRNPQMKRHVRKACAIVQ